MSKSTSMRHLSCPLLLALILFIAGCHGSRQGALALSQNPASGETNESLDHYKGPLTVKVDGKFGYIDRAGKLIIKPQFNSAESFSDGLAMVCLGRCSFFGKQIKVDESKYGFIDETGKYIVNPQYDGAASFSEGLARVCTGDSGYEPEGPHKYGFIDLHGNVVIPLQFGDVYSFSEGFAAACVGRCTGQNEKWEGKWGFIDETGKFTIGPQFDEVGLFAGGDRGGISRNRN